MLLEKISGTAELSKLPAQKESAEKWIRIFNKIKERYTLFYDVFFSICYGVFQYSIECRRYRGAGDRGGARAKCLVPPPIPSH